MRLVEELARRLREVLERLGASSRQPLPRPVPVDPRRRS